MSTKMQKSNSSWTPANSNFQGETFDPARPFPNTDKPTQFNSLQLQPEERENHFGSSVYNRTSPIRAKMQSVKASTVNQNSAVQSTPITSRPSIIQRVCDECSQKEQNSQEVATNPQSRSFVQPKLTIGSPGDKYEQEADQVSRQVVQRINSPQTTINSQIDEDKDEPIQKQSSLITSVVQRIEDSQQDKTILNNHNNFVLQTSQPALENSAPEVQANFENNLNSAKGRGSPLDKDFRSKIEPVMGANFSGVRVHTDNNADQLNQSIQARAFTTGQDIFFRQGEYELSSRGGQELLAHELTHVIQQGQAKPMVQAKESQQGEPDEDEIRQEMNTMSPLNGDESGSELVPEPKEGTSHAQANQIKQRLETNATDEEEDTEIQAQIESNTIQMARDYNVYPWPADDTEYCTVEVAEGQENDTDFIKGSATGSGAFPFQYDREGSMAAQSSFYGHFTSPAGNIGSYGWGVHPSFNLTSTITARGGAGSWSAVHGCTFGSDIEATHPFTVHEPVLSISEPTVSPVMYDFLGAVPFQLEGIGEMAIKLSQSHIRNTGFTAQRSFGTVNTVQQAHSFGLDLVPTASIGPISAGGGASFGWSAESSESLEDKIEGTDSIQSANTVTNWQEDKIKNTSENEKQSWMVLPEYVWKEWTVWAMPHDSATLRKTGNYTESKIGGLFATGGFQKVRSNDPSAVGSQAPNLDRNPTGSAIPSVADFGAQSDIANQARAANAQAAGYQAVDTSFVTDTDHIQFMKLVDHKPAARDYQAQYGRAIPSGRGSTTIGGSTTHQVSEGYAVANSRTEADGVGSSSNTNIGGSIAGIGDSLSLSNTSSAVNTTGQTLTRASGSSATTEWSWSVNVPQKENQRQFQIITPLCRVQTWELLHGCRQNSDPPNVDNDFEKAYLVTVKAHIVPHSYLQDIAVGEDIAVGLPDPFIL